MSGVKILGTGSYLPEDVVCNDDFAKIVETSDEWIFSRTGMRERRIARHETSWYMGAEASKKAIEAAGIDALEIDMVLVATVTPTYFFPSTSCLIQGEVGAKNAFSIDISVACSGFAYALDMAHRYLATSDVKTVLVVGTENLTQMLDYTDRATCVLFGDGAGACIVQKSDGMFGSFLRSDASGGKYIYNKRERKNLPFFDDCEDTHEPFPAEKTDSVFMNGREVYKFATRAMPEAVIEACGRAGITPDDLDVVIPHQANVRILNTAAKNLKLPYEKMFVNIEKYSNTNSASMLIGLDECVREGRLKRGDKVCVVGFGAGLTYGACVFEY